MRYHFGFLWRFVVFALPFWSAEHKWMNRGRLALIAALTVAQVAVQVGLNSWSARLYNALEARQLDTFLQQIVTFVALLLASLFVFSVSLYVKRRLQFAWRVWLTKNTLSTWMAEGRHYQLGLIAGDHDNPDGRIAEDIRVTTESAVDLGQSLFYCILLLGTFVSVLWELSGVIHVEIGGTVIAIPGFMVFIALTYSVIGTSMALWAGLPLVGASNLRQTVEANFRFGLARAREYSESIALIGGDTDERIHLQELLRGVRRGWESQTDSLVRIILFTTAYSVLASPFPLLVAAPRYIMGLITLGTLMQMAQAFQQVTAALSFPIDNLSNIAQWRASVERVMALQEALGQLQEKLGENRIEVRHEGDVLQFAGVRVMEHDAVPLMHEITAEIGPGEHVLIEGDTQLCHTLLLAVTGLWPWGTGKVTLPADANIFIASDRPYLPVGALGEAVCYPLALGVCSPTNIDSALRRVGLSDWAEHLGVVENWDHVLSAAQKQRLSFARILLHRPDWIFLAEATNALDEATQREMAQMLVEELPSAAVVAVGRTGLFDGFFRRVLHVEAETASR
ncbi:MAG: ABC transporter ATP-binding protein/permease [Ferrovibrio sp.]|uniref:ABC transporter ATP-binding protein/permease n=1 Tax=Ferrovibrio sp. TaxID=1917215 RepID=UPI002624485A|nr:ABC transporter ATP-binding protein/permease [Ferrovibrio sp.]MCW0232107.1 ABC transporter ATP-binding protein/permease [Ferrovibrio sp.]